MPSAMTGSAHHSPNQVWPAAGQDRGGQVGAQHVLHALADGGTRVQAGADALLGGAQRVDGVDGDVGGEQEERDRHRLLRSAFSGLRQGPGPAML